MTRDGRAPRRQDLRLSQSRCQVQSGGRDLGGMIRRRSRRGQWMVRRLRGAGRKEKRGEGVTERVLGHRADVCKNAMIRAED